MRKRFVSILLSVIIALSMIPLFTVFAADYNAEAKSVSHLSTPVLSSAYVNNAGTVIKWNKVKGAAKYRVFYKAGSSWKRIADTSSTSYTWSGAKTGTKYTFTVRCVSGDGRTYVSGFDSAGKTVTCLPAPKVSSISNTASGVQLKWSKVSGAEKYRVFRKTAGKAWSDIGTTTAVSFTDKNVKSGTAYSYTVRCISSNGKIYTSGFDAAGKKITFLSAPVTSSVYVNNAGAVIKWNKVNGAAKYRVFYKTGNGSYVKLTDTTSTSYTWSGAKIGNKYTFTIRCLSSDGKSCTSAYNQGKEITVLSMPEISSIRAINSGTQINWSKVSGAEKYKVFRKAGNGAWSIIGTTASTSFTDTSAAKGTEYVYTVRCVNKDGKIYTSGYFETGMKFTALATPKISSLSAASNGVKIGWSSVAKAEKYEVFRKTGSGSWVALTTTNATSFLDTTAKSGNKYSYTVRCISADCRTYTSGYDTAGKSISFVAAPKLSSVSATSTGIKISWGKVSGAEKYRVFRKTPNGNWTTIGNTAYTNFTDIQAKKGTTYTYTVRCINNSGNSYTSAYDTVGKSATSVSSPVTKNDMVRVAEKQLGYAGGQKIWKWAGYDRRVPWCNLFITWCANELGYYQSGRIPLYQAPRDTAKWFKSKGLFKNPNYIPQPGDLIFFALYGETTPYHIGLVEKYENGTVYTIEGNSDDVVKRRSYAHDNYRIYGYATPDYGHN